MFHWYTSEDRWNNCWQCELTINVLGSSFKFAFEWHKVG